MKDIVPLSVFRSVPGDQFMNLQDIRVKKILFDCKNSDILTAIQKVSKYVNEKMSVSHKNCKLAKLIKHTVKQKIIEQNIIHLQTIVFKKLQTLYPPKNMTNFRKLVTKITMSDCDRTCDRCLQESIIYTDKHVINENFDERSNTNHCCQKITLPSCIEQNVGADLFNICEKCLEHSMVALQTDIKNVRSSVIECTSEKNTFCQTIVFPKHLKSVLLEYMSNIPKVDEEKVYLFSSQFITSNFHSWKDQTNKKMEENKIARLQTKNKAIKKKEEKKNYWCRSKILVKLARQKIMNNPHIYMRRWEKNPKGLGTRQPATQTPFIIEGAENPPVIEKTNIVSDVTILRGKKAAIANKLRKSNMSQFWEEFYKENEKDDMQEKKKSIAKKRNRRNTIQKRRQHSLYSFDSYSDAPFNFFDNYSDVPVNFFDRED